MSGLKQRLAGGDLLFGTFLKTPCHIVVEVMASCGLDLLCIDAEHAPFDRIAIDACVMAARAGGLPVLVRTPSAAPEHILNALDSGADGVLLPHIRSAEEAAAAVQAAHYGRGGRGYAGSSRAAGYGGRGMAEHLEASSARTVVIAQIEDVEALDHVDAIASVAGLDALFVGRMDLTVALGASSPDEPEVIAAVEGIAQAARSAGRCFGMFVPRNADVPRWREAGASLFLQGSDHSFLRTGASAARREAEF
jgi:2-keto-3-deoxy-L-rhamnonate aldolase RhmA